MNIFKQAMTASALSSLILTGACVHGGVIDPDAGMPVPMAIRTGEVLTPDKVVWHEQQVMPRCKQVARETTPSAERVGGAYAINHAVAGGASAAVGGVIGSKVEYSLLHATMGPHVAIAIAAESGISGAIQGGAQGYVGGAESANARYHGALIGCSLNDGAGLHEVAPSVMAKVKSGTLPPQNYDAPWEHNTPPVRPAT